MAKTYRSEGKQISNALTGIFLIGGLVLYFIFPGLGWEYCLGILIGSVIIGQILGAAWTRKRRASQKEKRKSKAITSKTTPSGSEKLSNDLLLQANVDTLLGTDFERLMELYYIDQGYTVQRIGGSGDHGVDLILQGKEGYKIAVQCKRQKDSVGNDVVLKLKAGKQVHGCYDAWVVTTSNYTKDARDAAEKLNIRLINGLVLNDMLNKWKNTRSATRHTKSIT